MQDLFLPELLALILSLGTFLGLFMQSTHAKVAYLFNIIYHKQKNKLLKSHLINEEIKYILLFNEIGIQKTGWYSNALFILTEYNFYIYKKPIFAKSTFYQYKYSDIKRHKYKEGILGNSIELMTTDKEAISLVYHEVGNYTSAIQYLDKMVNNKEIKNISENKEELAVFIRFLRAIVSFSRMTFLLPIRWIGFHIKNPFVVLILGSIIGFILTIMPENVRSALWTSIMSLGMFTFFFGL